MRQRVGSLASLMGMVMFPVAAWAQERSWDHWGHPMWGMWGAWGIGMMLFMVFFWGLILVGLVLGLRWLVTQGRETRPDAALEILRQRYARGEINQDEFDTRKRDLG